MSWPQACALQFLTDEGVPASRVLVLITLLAPKKNDYPLDWKFTDENGNLILSKEEVVEYVQQQQKDYPMDYRSSFEDCDTLELILENKRDLAARAEGLVRFYPDQARKLRILAQGARNLRGSWRTQVKIAPRPVIRIPKHVL